MVYTRLEQSRSTFNSIFYKKAFFLTNSTRKMRLCAFVFLIILVISLYLLTVTRDYYASGTTPLKKPHEANNYELNLNSAAEDKEEAENLNADGIFKNGLYEKQFDDNTGQLEDQLEGADGIKNTKQRDDEGRENSYEKQANDVDTTTPPTPDMLAALIAKQVSRSKRIPESGTVWPLPQKIEYGSANRTIRKNGVIMIFRGPVKEPGCDIIQFARKTYTKQWLFPSLKFQGRINNSGTITLSVSLKRRCPSLNEYPQEDMNEEYRLKVPLTGEAILEAEEIWGVLRGLETFSQLIYRQESQYFIRTATIHDWPEYRTRGVLLDTSRHYLTPAMIKRQIDIMAQNKMNLFHWHIVDMESFPYVSPSFPNLTKGAFTPRHVYTSAMIQDIVRHCRLRGVRVMAEFDTPGHMGSWAGQTGLLADCFNKNGTLVQPAMIDPSNEGNFEFLRLFFREVLEIFPDRWLHLGGDEAWYWTEQCWARNPKIQAFMREKKLANATELEQYYIGRLQDIIGDRFSFLKKRRPNEQRRMVYWDEITAFKPDPSMVVVHLWTSSNRHERAERLQKLTQDGYKVLLSSCWYLNLINYGADWSSGNESRLGEGPYYGCDPRGFNGTDEQKRLVLGGVATMWGEYVDGTNLESRLWPRASAVAERLWSPPALTKSAANAWPRLHEHRCRLIARGYHAEPLNGPDFCMIEWDALQNDDEQ